MPNLNDGVHIEISANGTDAIKELNSVNEKIEQVANGAHEISLKVNVSNDLGQIQNVANEAVEKLSSKIQEISSSFNTFGKTLEQKFGTLFKSILAGATTVSGALSVVVKNALSIGGGFETQITNVKVISGATEQELDMLINKAREMGATLPITAQDAASAMLLLAQRGTKAKEIFETVSDISALAISQNISMSDAAGLVGSTMTNFGLAVNEAAKITDIFNNASNQSALDMSKMIEAMKYVGPAASSAGISLTEIVSAMEVLANSGLSGEMIGTGLSTALTKIAKDSQILGVKTKNLDGSMRPLKDIFSELQEKGLSLGEATALFGQRANKVALNLAQNSSSLEENERNLQRWGATQNAVQEKMKTWDNVWNSFQSASEEVHIEIFDQIKDQSKEIVSSIADLTRTFSEFLQKTQLASKSFGAFLEGLGFSVPSGADFKTFLEQINVDDFVNKVKSFGSSIATIGQSIANLCSALKAPISFLIENLDTFGKIAFWGWIIGKGLQVPIAIMGIATAFKTLYASIKSSTIIGGVISSFKTLFDTIRNPAAIMHLISSFKELFSYLSTLPSMIANSVKAFYGLYGLTGIAGYLGTLSVALGIAIQKGNEQYKEAVEIINAEKQIATAYEKIKAIEGDNSNQGELRTGFEDLPDDLNKTQSSLIDIESTVNNLRKNFKEKIAQAVQEVNSELGSFGENFKDAASEIDDVLATKITRALQGSQEEYEALPAYWQKVTAQLVNMGVSAGQTSGSIEELIATSSKALQNVSDLVNAPMQKSKESVIETWAKELSHTVNAIVNEVPEKIKHLTDFIGENNASIAISVSLDEAQLQLREFISTIATRYSIPEDIVEVGLVEKLRAIGQQGNAVAQSLSNTWESSRDSMSDFINRAQEAMKYLNQSPNEFIPALEQLKNSIQKIDPVTGRITEGFKRAYDTLKEWNNTSFDQLSKRIQKLKKAIEGGFIKKSTLQDEYRNVAAQIKSQVVSELQGTKDMYKSPKAYQSVVASEFMSRLSDMGGDVFVEKAKQEFAGKTGAAIGRAILYEVSQGVEGIEPPRARATINGKTKVIDPDTGFVIDEREYYKRAKRGKISIVDPTTGAIMSENEYYKKSRSANKNTTSLSSQKKENSLKQEISRAAFSELSGAANSLMKTTNNAAETNTPNFQELINSIEKLKGYIESNTMTLNSIQLVIVSAIENLKRISDILSINGISNPNINDYNEFDYNNLDWTSLSVSVNYLKSAVDSFASSIDSIKSSWQNQNNTYNNNKYSPDFSNAIVQIVGALQANTTANSEGFMNVVTSISALENSLRTDNEASTNNDMQSINSIVTPINSSLQEILSQVKSIQASNNYDIDINQTGFVVNSQSQANSLANATASAIKSGIGNGGI